VKRLPRVDLLADAPELAPARELLGRRAVVGLVREVLAEQREFVRAGGAAIGAEEALKLVAGRAEQRRASRLRAVINATGVVLHTNLGRAPLPPESAARLTELAWRYTSVELDLELGTRSRRAASIEAALAEISGAESALLVVNNAAAVLLALSTLAAGREVVVSRGELVEIGGGFRIPEVLVRSGARLREVGTTNRTRVGDYAAAIDAATACVLRVHPSNFRISGFTERPSLRELCELSHERGVPLVKDLGGGLVSELPGIEGEPSVQSCLTAGADLVCFSLDKLFGGPQGGVIVGKRELVSRLRDDPLARALRVDKLILLALEPVIEAYQRGQSERIPVHAMLRARPEALEERIRGWQRALGELAARTTLIETTAAAGGGTLPEEPLGSRALSIRTEDAEGLSRALRRGDPAVLPRIADGAVLLDARTVLPGEDEALIAALRAALSLENQN